MPDSIARATKSSPDRSDSTVQRSELESSLRHAESMLAAGKLSDAKRLAAHALEIVREPDDERLRGWALLVHGSANCLDAQYELAYLNASEAYELLLLNDHVRALEAVMVLVAVYCETDDFDRAMEAAKSGIELSISHAEPVMTIRLLHSLGWVLHRGGEFRRPYVAWTRRLHFTPNSLSQGASRWRGY